MTIEIKRPPSISESRLAKQSEIARRLIYAEIDKERDYQDKKWGGAPHDDNETMANFVGYIVEYSTGASERASRHDIRTRLVKTAALAVAALESYDRRAALQQPKA